MAFGDGQGTLNQRLAALEAMTPEQQSKLIAASMAGDKLGALDKSSTANEESLRRQMEQAQALAFSPIHSGSGSPIAQGATLTANALRMLGGLIIAGKREKDLASARAESEAARQGLFSEAEQGAGIVTDNERSGLRDYLGKTPMSRALIGHTPAPSRFGWSES